MSRVEDLIAEHCPSGVRYVSIAEFAECVVGGTPSSGNPLFWDEGTIPWMKSGEVNKSIIFETENLITQLGFASCSARLVPAGSVVMALAGQGKTRGLVARTRIELCTNQSLCAITPNESVDSDYLYFFLTTQYQRLRETSSGDGSRGGLNLSMIRNYRIPVPPLEVQREIVRVLDLFQSLEAELEAELEARRRQYAHYRDSLLDFTERGGVRWMTLGEIAVLEYGFTAAAADEGDLRYVRITDIDAGGKLVAGSDKFVESTPESDRYRLSAGDVLVARTGASFGKSVLIESNLEAVFASFLIRLRSDREIVNPQFLWHFAQSGGYWAQARKLVSVGGQPQFNGNVLSRVVIPVPSLEDQQEIVVILDKFDALVNDLSVGLPAELAARRSQYEYYRDRLLTFEEAA